MKTFAVPSSYPRRSSLLAFVVLWGALRALPGFAQSAAPKPALPEAPAPQPSALNNGSPEEASRYYKELSKKLGVLTPATIESQATLEDLLSYLGYKELTPEDVEFAKPESLMEGTATLAQALPVGGKVALKADTGSFMARSSEWLQSKMSIPAGVIVPDLVVANATRADAGASSLFEVVDAGGGKIGLKADTGNYVSRCNGCVAQGTIEDFATVHVPGATPPPLSQFTPELLPNGTVAFKANTGNYLARCRNCSPRINTPDAVGIHATDARNQPSAQWTIVRVGVSSGDILVSRFFAPKIVNFKDNPAERKTGWRRLVRMKSRPGSEARKHFVESAWILFNHFTGPSVHSPFGGTNVPLSAKNGSVNTQVALITQCKAGQTACQNAELNSIYWMDFGPSNKGYKLSYKLDAFFDAGSLPGAAPYYVPNGCDTCHGSLRGQAVLNHLDTDHWLDRLTDGDFPALNKPDAPPVLFDAGKDVKSARYAEAFGVLRQLNQEVADMQKRVNPKGFHLVATNKWLELHKTSVAPEPSLIKRAISFSNTGHPLKKDRKPTAAPLDWTSSADDKELLGLMNTYCYRCHGAVRYDVFSKDMVADQSSPILDRLDPNPTQAKIIGFKMPVDREMSDKDKKRMIELIEKLYTQTH
ncbi:fascin domain-containing protein [Archangium violaceum]|uniref:fascin domain-containing protein n=1 Tax=Archangium violaceum TaxID=83451 RepID=UPI0036DBFB74